MSGCHVCSVPASRSTSSQGRNQAGVDARLMKGQSLSSAPSSFRASSQRSAKSREGVRLAVSTMPTRASEKQIFWASCSIVQPAAVRCLRSS